MKLFEADMTVPKPENFRFSIPFLNFLFSQKFNTRQGGGAPVDKKITASMAFTEGKFPLIHFRGRSSHSARLQISISSLLIITRYFGIERGRTTTLLQLIWAKRQVFSFAGVSIHA